MAKRSRVSGRPGQRRRPGRSGARPAARPGQAPIPNVLGSAAIPNVIADSGSGSSSLTEAELARAAELEAQILAEERAATRPTAASRAMDAARAGSRFGAADPALTSQPLGVRAAHEYAYVARDVRRIIVTGGLMLSILIVLDVLINVAGVIKA